MPKTQNSKPSCFTACAILYPSSCRPVKQIINCPHIKNSVFQWTNGQSTAKIDYLYARPLWRRRTLTVRVRERERWGCLSMVGMLPPGMCRVRGETPRTCQRGAQGMELYSQRSPSLLSQWFYQTVYTVWCMHGYLCAEVYFSKLKCKGEGRECRSSCLMVSFTTCLGSLFIIYFYRQEKFNGTGSLPIRVILKSQIPRLYRSGQCLPTKH